jgi:hypothetical protein
MQFDMPISWSLSAVACWIGALAGAPTNGQIAAALVVQVVWLVYRSF